MKDCLKGVKEMIKTFKRIGLIFALLQLILSIVVVALIIKFNILPSFYIFVIVFVLTLFFLIRVILFLKTF